MKRRARAIFRARSSSASLLACSKWSSRIPAQPPAQTSTVIGSAVAFVSSRARAGQFISTSFRLGFVYRLFQPCWHAYRPECAGIDERVQTRALGQALAVPLDQILAAEAGASEIEAAGIDTQLLVEASRREVANVYLHDRRLDSLIADCLVTAGVLGEISDSGGLEPDEERGMMGYSGRVGLGEADGHLGEEVKRRHRGTLEPGV